VSSPRNPADSPTPTGASDGSLNPAGTAPSRGRLIMAGNSLGNPADIPPRSLAALREADLLIFEEPQGARRALKAAGIHREFLLYSEHRESETMRAAREAFATGKTVLYMSDQGMPAVADPGRDLLREAYARGTTVDVIPGPSSITSAIAVCPYDCEPFVYLGLLPRQQPERLKALARAKTLGQTIVILDTPYRLDALLSDTEEIFGPRHPAFVAFDISGPRQMFWKGLLSEIRAKASALEEKINFVLIVPGRLSSSSGGGGKSSAHGSHAPTGR
jgi:16S rRNA (cytidine1402-2'-O)-methyltransferase